MPKKPHHRGSYQRRAEKVVAAAYANPATVCGRCGYTLDQHPPHPSGRKQFWTAGHVNDGDPWSPLQPEASRCNFRAGTILRNRGLPPGANPHASRG